MVEREAGLEQFPRHHAAAFQQQLRLGAHEERADREHPCRRRQAELHAVRLAQCPHEIAVRHRIWRAHVDRPAEFPVIEAPVKHPQKILHVQPTDVLRAGPLRAAKPKPGDVAKRLEHTARAGAEHHRQSHRDTAGVRRRRIEQRPLPAVHHIDGELPLVPRPSFWHGIDLAGGQCGPGADGERGRDGDAGWECIKRCGR